MYWEKSEKVLNSLERGVNSNNLYVKVNFFRNCVEVFLVFGYGIKKRLF